MFVSVYNLPVTDESLIEKKLTEILCLQRRGVELPMEVLDWADYANNVLDNKNWTVQ